MIVVNEEKEDECRAGLSVPVFFDRGAVTLHPYPDPSVPTGQPRHHEGVGARGRGAPEWLEDAEVAVYSERSALSARGIELKDCALQQSVVTGCA
jgi:hypothetical protein